jgi:hypothetical protein
VTEWHNVAVGVKFLIHYWKKQYPWKLLLAVFIVLSIILGTFITIGEREANHDFAN